MTLPDLIKKWADRVKKYKGEADIDQVFTLAITDRLGLEFMGYEQMEAKIARMEQAMKFAEFAEKGLGQYGARAAAAQQSIYHVPRTATEVQAEAARLAREQFVAVAARSPRAGGGLPPEDTMQAPAGVSTECGCGGKPGHVPNGVWCRRPA